MKLKCFFCEKYTVNMKFHVKRCNEFRQISSDVFNNCILSFYRLDKLKHCINMKMYNFVNQQNILKSYPSFINNENDLYLNTTWTFIGCDRSYTYTYFINVFQNYTKRFPTNKNYIYLISATKYNLKFFTIIDKSFEKIIFFFHKYTKKSNKVYGLICFNINTMEKYLNIKGIDLMFDIANIYMSLINLKKKLNNIYNE
jgi:hypothetical protein